MTTIDAGMARRTGQAQNSGATRPHLSKHEKHELVDQLGGYTFFSRCCKDDLGALVDVGGPFVIPPNWPLMLEATPAHACYAITEGSARVFINRVQIAELGPGDIIGEMAVLTGDLRRATVTSATRLRGLRVDNDDLTALFVRRPQLLSVLQGAYEARTPVAHRQRIREILRAGGFGFAPVSLPEQPGSKSGRAHRGPR